MRTLYARYLYAGRRRREPEPIATCPHGLIRCACQIPEQSTIPMPRVSPEVRRATDR